jgi:hypothetical protein
MASRTQEEYEHEVTHRDHKLAPLPLSTGSGYGKQLCSEHARLWADTNICQIYAKETEYETQPRLNERSFGLATITVSGIAV